MDKREIEEMENVMASTLAACVIASNEATETNCVEVLLTCTSSNLMNEGPEPYEKYAANILNKMTLLLSNNSKGRAGRMQAGYDATLWSLSAHKNSMDLIETLREAVRARESAEYIQSRATELVKTLAEMEACNMVAQLLLHDSKEMLKSSVKVARGSPPIFAIPRPDCQCESCVKERNEGVSDDEIAH